MIRPNVDTFIACLLNEDKPASCPTISRGSRQRASEQDLTKPGTYRRLYMTGKSARLGRRKVNIKIRINDYSKDMFFHLLERTVLHVFRILLTFLSSN